MSRYILVSILFLSFFSYSQNDSINLNWLTSLEKAKEMSEKSNIPVLIYFTGSDWCAPCIKLKEDFFETKEFEEISSKFILVLIDKPRRLDIISEEQMIYNDKIIAQYNNEKIFPRMVIINFKGKVLDDMSGYSYIGNTTNHFAFLYRNI